MFVSTSLILLFPSIDINSVSSAFPPSISTFCNTTSFSASVLSHFAFTSAPCGLNVIILVFPNICIPFVPNIGVLSSDSVSITSASTSLQFVIVTSELVEPDFESIFFVFILYPFKQI